MTYDPELAERRRAQRQAVRDRWPAEFERAQAQAPDPDPELARDVQSLLARRAVAE